MRGRIVWEIIRNVGDAGEIVVEDDGRLASISVSSE